MNKNWTILIKPLDSFSSIRLGENLVLSIVEIKIKTFFLIFRQMLVGLLIMSRSMDRIPIESNQINGFAWIKINDQAKPIDTTPKLA